MKGKDSLKDAIYNAILESIISQEYRPNQVLNEKTLVEKYGCSKSPVREALVSLCNDNVLRNIPRYGYEVVNVRPQPKAGGSFATTAWERFAHPVAVEHIRAKAGMDIGGTLIGMHLGEVAVPVRLSVTQIGQAPILCARTRPKFIGGERAQYCDEMK